MEDRNTDSVRKLLANKLTADVYSRVTDEQVNWLLQNQFDTAEMFQDVKAEDLVIPPFTRGVRRKIVEAFSTPGLSLSAAIHDVLGSESIKASRWCSKKLQEFYPGHACLTDFAYQFYLCGFSSGLAPLWLLCKAEPRFCKLSTGSAQAAAPLVFVCFRRRFS